MKSKFIKNLLDVLHWSEVTFFAFSKSHAKHRTGFYLRTEVRFMAILFFELLVFFSKFGLLSKTMVDENSNIKTFPGFGSTPPSRTMPSNLQAEQNQIQCCALTIPGRLRISGTVEHYVKFKKIPSILESSKPKMRF